MLKIGKLKEIQARHLLSIFKEDEPNLNKNFCYKRFYEVVL